MSSKQMKDLRKQKKDTQEKKNEPQWSEALRLPLGEIALSDFEKKKRAVNCSLDFHAIVITQKYRIDQ